jgi:predicted DNA-binding protein YlxM (UPF0122 family)
MPTRSMSMPKIKEALRLYFELGLRLREIARACSISQRAVHHSLKKAAQTLGEAREVGGRSGTQTSRSQLSR